MSTNAEKPTAILLHPGMDAADLIAAHHRTRLLADALTGSRRSPPTVFDDRRHHAIHVAANGNAGLMTGVEDHPEHGLVERYEMNSIAAVTRTFSLLVAIHPDAARPLAADTPADDVAARLHRHADALKDAAQRASRYEDAEIPCAPSTLVRQMIEDMLPGALPTMSCSIVSRLYADGHVDVRLREAMANREATAILRPAARDLLIGRCHPGARLSATTSDVRTDYVMAPVRITNQRWTGEGDPVAALRRVADLGQLAVEPFTEEFMARHRHLAR